MSDVSSKSERKLGELIDLWDVPLTAVSNPDHLKLVKANIAFVRIHTDDEAS